ncbi:MAG: GIY-YIG nuclease family protein [Elusimicrobiota bacterium]
MNQKKSKIAKSRYYVYIVECSDNTLYTGYTKDLDKRIDSHNTGKGAKYTSGRAPVKLRWFRIYNTLSKALREEYRIKKLSRIEKMKLLERKIGLTAK